MITLASSHEDLSISGDEWNSNPWSLGVENGVIDLKTGEFRPGQPGDFISAHAPTEWKGIDATAPRWEEFIMEIFAGDLEITGFVQRLLGPTWSSSFQGFERILGWFQT